MPLSVLHVLTATTPDNTSYEIRPSHWNSSHSVSLSLVGSEIIGAFTNTNGVSFGLQGSQITASFTSPPSGISVSAGNAALNLASLVFSNQGNVSFGLNGSTLTASASFAQSVQSFGLSDSVNTGLFTGALFQNSNNVSLGLSNGTITASASFAQSTQLFAISASNGSTNATGLVFSNANSISFGIVGNTITASIGNNVSYGVAVSAGANSISSGTLVFSNANGVSFGMNSAGALTATVTPGPSAGIAAISAGTTQVTTGTVAFANSNGVSFGFTNGSITATVTPGAAAGIAAVEAGTATFTQTNGTLYFGNANGATFGISGSSVTMSYSVPTQSTQPVAISGSNGSSTFNTLTMGNANGLSFYMSNGSLVGSYTVPAQALLSVAASGSNGSSTFSTLSFGNLNGLSHYFLNGSIVASYSVPSTAGLLSALNVSAGPNVSNVQSLVFSNSNNVSFGLSGNTLTAQVTGLSLTVSAGTQAAGVSNLVMSNSNGVSFGFNNGTITGSVNAISAFGVSGSTQTGGSLAFSNANGISFGLSASQITASYTVPAVSNFLSAFDVSAGTQSSNLKTLVLSNSNGISFGLNNGTITASFNNGAAIVGTINAVGTNTTYTATGTYNASALNISLGGVLSGGWSGATLVISAPGTTSVAFAGTGFSGTNAVGTINSNGLSLSVPSVSAVSGLLTSSSDASSNIRLGVAGTTRSIWQPPTNGALSVSQLGQGKIQVFPAFPDTPISVSRADIYGSFSMSSSSNSSFAGTIGVFVGFYTRNGSTLSLASSGSQSYAYTNTSNGSLSALSGLCNLSLPINANVAPQDLWLAVMSTTSSANANWLTGSNLVYSNQIGGLFNGLFGAGANSTQQQALGLGQYSASSNALPLSMAFSNIVGSSNTTPPAIVFHNVSA